MWDCVLLWYWGHNCVANKMDGKLGYYVSKGESARILEGYSFATPVKMETSIVL